MSTRSAIIEKTETGYRGVYCHFDGDEEGVGATLLEHYKDDDKIHRLIDLGDIASLGKRVEPIGEHNFHQPEKKTTVAYHRDRGKNKTNPITGITINEVAKQIDHDGYIYVWENGEWFLNGESLNQVIASILG